MTDGWQTDGTPPEVLRVRWQQVREYAAEYGRAHEVMHNSVHLVVNINNYDARAKRESVEFLDHYYGAGTIAPEKLDAWLPFGSPASVIDKVMAFVEAGCNGRDAVHLLRSARAARALRRGRHASTPGSRYGLMYGC